MFSLVSNEQRISYGSALTFARIVLEQQHIGGEFSWFWGAVGDSNELSSGSDKLAARHGNGEIRFLLN